MVRLVRELAYHQIYAFDKSQQAQFYVFVFAIVLEPATRGWQQRLHIAKSIVLSFNPVLGMVTSDDLLLTLKHIHT